MNEWNVPSQISRLRWCNLCGMSYQLNPVENVLSASVGLMLFHHSLQRLWRMKFYVTSIIYRKIHLIYPRKGTTTTICAVKKYRLLTFQNMRKYIWTSMDLWPSLKRLGNTNWATRWLTKRCLILHNSGHPIPAAANLWRLFSTLKVFETWLFCRAGL